MARRNLLSTVGALALGAKRARGAAAERVFLTGDGVPLTPRERARLLTDITERRQITMDNYSLGGVVAELEQRMAALLGKERAVFFATGTLANHMGVRLLAKGGRALTQAESHLYRDSGDCVQRLSAINLTPLAPHRAAFTLADVEEQVESAADGRVAMRVGAISIETPVRRLDGEVMPFSDMKAICEYARRRGIGTHLDGSRLFLAAPYTGVSVKQYAALFDTVYVSTFKYFNANFGAVLAGPDALLKDLYQERRMFGGGVPHAWAEAAVSLHYLDGFEQRYSKAVAAAEQTFERVAKTTGIEVRRVKPGTNIAFLRLKDSAADGAVNRLKAAGVAVESPRAAVNGWREVAVRTNETILRAPAEETARRISAAIEG